MNDASYVVRDRAPAPRSTTHARRSGTALLALLPLALLLVGCGGNNGSTASSASGGGSSTTQPSSSGGGISTANVMGVGQVLVDTKGFTLYYLKTDAHSKVTCTGSCAQTWPPLLTTGSAPSGNGLPGTLGTIANPAGGTQITYDGWPLYTYSGDPSPGQANGQGIGGVWFAMTPQGADGGTSSGSSSSTSSSGGYG